MLKILMGPNVKILMGQSFGSWTHGPGPMALGTWALAAAGEVCGTRGGGGGGGGPAAAAHAPRAMGPCPCVQEPKLWPMSILTFGPISIFSIPFFSIPYF